jgi:hypothetical protein
MKKIILYFSLIILPLFILDSCRMGLDELPVFEEAELINFWFEHREIVTKTNPDGSTYETVVFTDLKSACTFQITSENENSADCRVTIDDSKVSKTINLTSIVGKATISTAATIQPTNSSPVLGIPGNFSNQVSYLVTAADNVTEKNYNITVVIQ